ncbi:MULTISPECIES: hypothetical protein [Chelatococcus]|uniref:Uncharacterized protein n=1 Tax=Chelatococcus caeni TaxID=1348468 RepID=A0A840C0S6_9HYPH|nr:MULTISPECIES: hypothetical protein [Chelatococcus]ALA16081.1 hypothetical protein AL346_00075 [Chelatococcus sp. CO-6]MBB4017582.1 hypothetical protein [Chelatococcus caeni]
MQLYDIKIRFSENDGIVFTEVLKKDVPASEVMFLQALHGPGRVHVLKASGEKQVHGGAERARLRDLYARGRETGRKVALMQQVFGPAHVPLPEFVPGYEPAPAVEAEGPAAAEVKPKRTRAKQASEPAEPAAEDMLG